MTLAEDELARLDADVRALPEPTLGLKGGVNRAVVLSLIAALRATPVADTAGIDAEYIRVTTARYADLEKLIDEAVEVAEYGLGRDGCPFCNTILVHDFTCIAKVFGARDVVDDVHPEQQ